MAGEGVGSGDGQLVVLADVAGRPGPKEYSQESHTGPYQPQRPGGTRQVEIEAGQEKAGGDADAGEARHHEGFLLSWPGAWERVCSSRLTTASNT